MCLYFYIKDIRCVFLFRGDSAPLQNESEAKALLARGGKSWPYILSLDLLSDGSCEG